MLVDDLSNANIEVLDKLKQISKKEEIPIIQLDVTDEKSVKELFATHLFDGVIHFAGYKAVGESLVGRRRGRWRICVGMLGSMSGINKYIFCSN